MQCVRDRKMGAQPECHGQRAEQDAAKLQRWPGDDNRGPGRLCEGLNFLIHQLSQKIKTFLSPFGNDFFF